MLKIYSSLYLDSSSTRNDLNQLSGNDSLSGTVVGQSQLVNHLTWKKIKKELEKEKPFKILKSCNHGYYNPNKLDTGYIHHIHALGNPFKKSNDRSNYLLSDK